MTDYTKLVKALRCCDKYALCNDCPIFETCDGDVDKAMAIAADAIEALQAQLPKRGKWIYEDLDNFRKYKVTCPHCGKWFVGNYDAYDEPSDFLYCPHCGNICNPTNLDWENELKEREKESRAKMGGTDERRT